MPGIDGKTHSLADYQDAKLLLIVFISNHCPDSHAAQGRILKLAAEMKDRGLAVVAINPNNPEGLSSDELGYTKYGDGFEDMKRYAAESKLTVPYLYDGQKQLTARAYGCLATPHVFSSTPERKLRYKGYFDDSRFAEKARSSRAMPAMRSERVGGQARAGRDDQAARLLDEVGRQAGDGRGNRREMGQDAGRGGADRRRGGGRTAKKWNPEGAAVQRLGDVVRAVPDGVSGVGEDVAEIRHPPFRAHHHQHRRPQGLRQGKAFLEKQHAGLLERLKPSLKAEGRTTNSYLFTAPTSMR